MKFEEKVIKILYSNLDKLATIDELKKYEIGKNRIKDIISIISIKEQEKYNKFIFYFEMSIEKDYCWTVSGFWNVLKEHFPESVNYYLKMKKAEEYFY